MHGENGVTIDLDEVARAIDDVDVLIVGFEICPERLLLDLRSAGRTPPLIDLVDPLGSLQERVQWLRERRPEFGDPARTVFFQWPHSIRFLAGSGLLRRAEQRLQREHGLDLSPRTASVLRRLARREHDFTRRALAGGEGFETLWSSGA